MHSVTKTQKTLTKMGKGKQLALLSSPLRIPPKPYPKVLQIKITKKKLEHPKNPHKTRKPETWHLKTQTTTPLKFTEIKKQKDQAMTTPKNHKGLWKKSVTPKEWNLPTPPHERKPLKHC